MTTPDEPEEGRWAKPVEHLEVGDLPEEALNLNVTAAPGPAAVGYAGQFLDIDVDQLTRCFPLIPSDRFGVGGSVTPVQATHPSSVQDALDGRRGQPDLEGDVVSTPPALTAQAKHLNSQMLRCPVRRPPRPRRSILESLLSFGNKPVPPLTYRLGIDLEPGSGRFDGPTPINDATDHAAAPLHGKRRIRMLPPRCSVSHEPSFEL